MPSNLKLIIACDDVNPLRGYRILGDKTESWFRKLNEEFGCRYSLFIPSNFHNQAPISQHTEWIQELSSIPWLELAAHGHFHMTQDSNKYGECEFAELNFNQSDDRISMMWEEWEEVDVIPKGFRPPGWLVNPESQRALNEFKVNIRPSLWDYPWFEYVAVHYEHNRGLNWNCKTFFGHDGIQQQTVAVHNGDMIMFQSHIAGKHNHNVWNEQNYDQLRLSLDYLFENYQIEPKLLNECL